MSKIETIEFKNLTGEEIEFASKICYSVRHKFIPKDTSRIMSMACEVFWVAMRDESNTNTELSKKASKKISNMFKCNTKLDTRNTPR